VGAVVAAARGAAAELSGRPSLNGHPAFADLALI
jgi:hypothetical protein